MKILSKFKIILYSTIVTTLYSCTEEPTFSSTPSIKYKGLELKENGNINISFSFQDEEGDIFTDKPLTNLIVKRFDNGFKAFYLTDSVPQDSIFQDRTQISDLVGLEFTEDSISARTFSDCNNKFETFKIDSESGLSLDFLAKKDTIAHNLKIRFFKKQNGKEVLLETLDLSRTECKTEDIYDSKIDQITDPGFTNAKEGELTYIIKDIGLPCSILKSDSFKIKLWVYDNMLNKSNVIESPDMFFSVEERAQAGCTNL